MSGDVRQLKVSDEQILLALFEAGSAKAAAEALGVNEKTVRRRLREPGMREQLDEPARLAWAATAAEYAAACPELVAAQVAIALDPEVSASVRLAAIRDALKAALEFGVARDVEGRLAALESAVGLEDGRRVAA